MVQIGRGTKSKRTAVFPRETVPQGGHGVKTLQKAQRMVTIDDDGEDDDQQGNMGGKVMQRLLQDAPRHDDADDDGHY